MKTSKTISKNSIRKPHGKVTMLAQIPIALEELRQSASGGKHQGCDFCKQSHPIILSIIETISGEKGSLADGLSAPKLASVANSLNNPFYCDSRPKSETEPRYWGMFLCCYSCGNADKTAKEVTLGQARKMVAEALNQKTNLCVECGG